MQQLKAETSKTDSMLGLIYYPEDGGGMVS
jgi:hypothetical protein